MMKQVNRTTAWLGAVMLSLGMAACGDGQPGRAEDGIDRTDRASEGARDAGREAGDAVKDAGRAAGDAVGTAGRAAGAAIETADVKSALIADARVEADQVDVDTDHTTKAVILKGAVPTMAQREIAEQIARREAGGYRIDNQLRVGR